jgi:hypothetical protein
MIKIKRKKTSWKKNSNSEKYLGTIDQSFIGFFRTKKRKFFFLAKIFTSFFFSPSNHGERLVVIECGANFGNEI